MYLCEYIYMHTYLYINVHMYMYIYIYIYIYAHIHIYIYITLKHCSIAGDAAVRVPGHSARPPLCLAPHIRYGVTPNLSNLNLELKSLYPKPKTLDPKPSTPILNPKP